VLSWAQVEQKWDLVRHNARTRWTALTDRDLDRIRGSRSNLVNRIQKIYGLDLDSAETVVEEWRRGVKV